MYETKLTMVASGVMPMGAVSQRPSAHWTRLHWFLVRVPEQNVTSCDPLICAVTQRILRPQ